jgi:hypothetical protein
MSFSVPPSKTPTERIEAVVAKVARIRRVFDLVAQNTAIAAATGQIFIHAPIVNTAMAIRGRLRWICTTPRIAKNAATASMRPIATGPKITRNSR